MILTQDNEFSAVLDVSALARMRTCELLMRCCEEPALFRILWTDKSLEDLHAQLLKAGYSDKQAEIRLRKMQEAFPEAKVLVPKGLLSCCSTIVEEGCKHVFAAAIRENANVIVSWYTKKYPEALARSFDVYIQSPDEFLVHQTHLNPNRVQDALDAQATAQRIPRSLLVKKLALELPLLSDTLQNI